MVKNSPIKGGLIVSISWIPISVKMYGLTLAGMKFGIYIFVIMMGSFPFTISQVFYGSKMKNLLDVISGKTQADSLVEVLPGVLAIAALGVLIGKLTRNMDDVSGIDN